MNVANTTILVTGGNGFIGSHLIVSLVQKGYRIILLKRSTSSLHRIVDLLDHLFMYDYDLPGWEQLFDHHKISHVIHLATHYKKGDVYSDIEPMITANITLPSKLLHLCCHHGVKNFINTGTFFEYDATILPLAETAPRKSFNFYADTKIAFEHILQAAVDQGKIQGATLKLFTPFGPRDEQAKLIPYIITHALRGDPFALSEGFQKLDFIYVQDIVEALIATVERIMTFKRYETFNIGSGCAHSIRDVVSLIGELMGSTLSPQWGRSSHVDASLIVSDIRKAAAQLGWTPHYSLREGLRQTIEHFRQERQ